MKRDPEIEAAALKIFPPHIVKAKTIKELKRDLNSHATAHPSPPPAKEPEFATPVRRRLNESNPSSTREFLMELQSFFKGEDGVIPSLIAQLLSFEKRVRQALNGEQLFTTAEYKVLTLEPYEELRVKLHEYYTKRHNFLIEMNESGLLNHKASSFFEKKQEILFGSINYLDKFKCAKD